MTREENLEKIKGAAIKANQEIILEEIEHYQGEQEPAIEIVTRPIRLADVLLVIKASPKCDTYWEYEASGGVVWGKPMHGEHAWNLRKDDLTEQSDECLQFLADVLK